MFETQKPSVIDKIHSELLEDYGIKLFVKRDDKLDATISGNKFRKLKYNLLEAQKQGKSTFLTFGGAYSNHIHAVAAAGYKYGFTTIGIIRGERIEPLNPTLQDAEALGMQLRFISREAYRQKEALSYQRHLKEAYGDFYMLPEGGSNVLAVKGAEEIAYELDREYDIICCCAGTGGTLAGIISGMKGAFRIMGFPALKGGTFLKADIDRLVYERTGKHYDNWQLITDYHFGGYAKWDLKLVHFMNQFKADHDIQLDPVYTGKMLYGLYDMIQAGQFKKGTRILAIHTGGLQGIRGFNQRFGALIY